MSSLRKILAEEGLPISKKADANPLYNIIRRELEQELLKPGPGAGHLGRLLDDSVYLGDPPHAPFKSEKAWGAFEKELTRLLKDVSTRTGELMDDLFPDGFLEEEPWTVHVGDDSWMEAADAFHDQYQRIGDKGPGPNEFTFKNEEDANKFADSLKGIGIPDSDIQITSSGM